MHCGVIVFPGSNCDHDCYHILKNVFGLETEWIWHKETMDLTYYDFIVLPGGFSYGDYLRSGAIAKFSPVMKTVVRYAGEGGRVLGICNGFQILVECGMLPGALMRNRGLKFICRFVHVRVENTRTPFTEDCSPGQVLRMPIAHIGGNFFAEPDTLDDLRRHNQIIFRYCDLQGHPSAEANPNGSLDSIAGITNREGNVLGMMPHPERASEELLSSSDGVMIFQSMMKSLVSKV